MAAGAGHDLVLHPGTIGLTDEQLRPGRVLALEVAFSESARLPAGVALDDYVPDGARRDVDAAAWAQLRAWRARRGAELTSDGVDLTHVFEVELLATCFLPLARLRAALPQVIAQLAPRRLVGAGLSAELLALVAAVAAEHGVRTVGSQHSGGSSGALAQAASPRAVRALAATGVPARVRGSVVCVSYWNLEPVLARLAARDSALTPVAYGVTIPLRDRSARLRAAWRGGWLGHPSGRARARSRAQAARLLDGLAAGPDATPEGCVDALALRELRRLSPDAFARHRQARRAFAGGRPRLVVVPFDSPENMRLLLSAAHDAGVGSLLVQHGFDAALNDPDKSEARNVAVWSERDRADVMARSDAAVTVTGNPGAAHLAPRRGRRAAARDRSLVLVEYPSRLSALVRERAPGEHVAAALAGLELARPGSTAVIRPHPADPYPAAYLRLAAAHPALSVQVDAGTPIERLLATVDLCVGALSTATLQAAVAGVPVVFLDVGGLRRPWPFGGAGGLPRADGAGALADMVGAALAREDVAGEQAAADALGLREDAIDSVCALVARLAS